MYNLITIGDPVIDTYVQIDDNASECRLSEINGETKLCLDYGAKIPLTHGLQTLGGNAPNVAIGATKLGLKTAIVTTVGKDANGKIAVSELKKQGVDKSFVSYDKTSRTRYAVILNYKKERTILSSYLDTRKYAWPKKFPQTEWIYYTGVGVGFETVQNNFMKELAAHPTIKLAINPGSYMLKHAFNDLLEMIKRADLLILNLEEAEKILNTTLEKEKNVEAMIHKLLAKGAKEVALTDGLNGAWAGNEDEVWFLPSFPVTVTSKTGAGDAFSAGYLAARSLGHDINHALEWGTANASSVVQGHSAQEGLLDKKGIEKMIEKFVEVKPTSLF